MFAHTLSHFTFTALFEGWVLLPHLTRNPSAQAHFDTFIKRGLEF